MDPVARDTDKKLVRLFFNLCNPTGIRFGGAGTELNRRPLPRLKGNALSLSYRPIGDMNSQL